MNEPKETYNKNATQQHVFIHILRDHYNYLLIKNLKQTHNILVIPKQSIVLVQAIFHCLQSIFQKHIIKPCNYHSSV